MMSGNGFNYTAVNYHDNENQPAYFTFTYLLQPHLYFKKPKFIYIKMIFISFISNA